MAILQETIDSVSQATDKYKYGFVTDIEMDRAPKGLNEDVVRFISAKKNEPEWLLEWRLKAFRHWLTMKEPTWGEGRLSADRLSGLLLLFGAQNRCRPAQKSRRDRP